MPLWETSHSGMPPPDSRSMERSRWMVRRMVEAARLTPAVHRMFQSSGRLAGYNWELRPILYANPLTQGRHLSKSCLLARMSGMMTILPIGKRL